MNQLPKLPMYDNDIIKRHVVKKDDKFAELLDEIDKVRKHRPINARELPDIDNIKPEIIDAINELIKEKWNGTKAIVHVYYIKEKAKMELDASSSINVESIILAYQRAGWNVVYEEKSKYFVFTKK